MAKEKFPFYRQLDYRDCGPTCLRMIAKFYGKTFSREFLRDKARNYPNRCEYVRDSRYNYRRFTAYRTAFVSVQRYIQKKLDKMLPLNGNNSIVK